MKIMMHARLMCFVFDVSGFQNETEDGSPPSGFVARAGKGAVTLWRSAAFVDALRCEASIDCYSARD